jgi:predicted metal-dependent peptidase
LISKTNEKVKNAFDFFIKKFQLDVTILIFPLTKKQQKDYPSAVFLIVQSERKLEDKTLFFIYFNEKTINKLSEDAIKKHAFHEILHILTWDFTNEFAETIKYVKDKNLKDELEKRHIDLRENVVYRMERKLGKFILGKKIADIIDP